MNLYFNIIIVSLLLLIIVLCKREFFLVEENEQQKEFNKLIGVEQARVKCNALKENPDFPRTHDDIYNSNMLYKYFTNGMFSNLQAIYKTPKQVRENPRFKNKPIINNPDYLVGASNEGSSALKSCEPCSHEKNYKACFNNIQIMDTDYCPKIAQCNGMPEIPYSASLKAPKGLDDKVQSVTKQIERLSKLKKEKKTEKQICEQRLCYIKKNPEIQKRYSEFNEIYKNISSKINNYHMETSLDFFNESDENIQKMKQFLIKPLNIYYFDLPGVTYEVQKEGLTITSQNKEEILQRTLVSEDLIKTGFENINNFVEDSKYKVKIRQDMDSRIYLLNLALDRMINYSNEIQLCAEYSKKIEC